MTSDMKKSKARSEGQGAQVVGQVREGPTEKVTVGQSPGWRLGSWPRGYPGDVCSRQREQQGARPCRREQLGCLLVAMGGACETIG